MGDLCAGIRIAGVCWLIAFGIGVIAIPGAMADLKVYDHFDADDIDPSWTVTMDLVTGWTYEVASSWLTVSQILFDQMHGDWSTVALTQEFAPLGDLTVNLDLAWDSAGSNTAMQNISLGLYDTNDDNVIWAIYHDAWSANRGRVTAIIDESIYDGPNNLPHSGTGSFVIARTDGFVSISWEGDEVLTGTTEAPIDRLELRFQAGAWPTATFGELAVDLISCEGEETTPVAGSTWGNIKALFR